MPGCSRGTTPPSNRHLQRQRRRWRQAARLRQGLVLPRRTRRRQRTRHRRRRGCVSGTCTGPRCPCGGASTRAPCLTRGCSTCSVGGRGAGAGGWGGLRVLCVCVCVCARALVCVSWVGLRGGAGVLAECIAVASRHGGRSFAALHRRWAPCLARTPRAAGRQRQVQCPYGWAAGVFGPYAHCINPSVYAQCIYMYAAWRRHLCGAGAGPLAASPHHRRHRLPGGAVGGPPAAACRRRCAVLCCAVLHRAVPCCDVPCCAMLRPVPLCAWCRAARPGAGIIPRSPRPLPSAPAAREEILQ